jgi:NosR/NirI family transcriptional regulator, nitrous oxide reductase regulator
MWIISLLAVAFAWFAGARSSRDILLVQLHEMEPSLTDIEKVEDDMFKAQSVYGEVYIAVDAVPGYGGPVKVAVVVDRDKRICRLAVLEAKETRSNFDDVVKSGLLDAFSGKRIDKMPVVQAVSGATMTSGAILESIDNAVHRIDAVRFGADYTETPRRIPQKQIAKTAMAACLFILALWVKSNRYPWSRKWGRRGCLLLSFVTLGVIFAAQPSLSTLVLFLSGSWTSGLASYTTLLCLLLSGFIVLITGNNLYCQMICPFGAIQEGLSSIFRPKAPALQPWTRWIPRLLVLVVICFGLYFRAPGNASYEPFSKVFSFAGSGVMFAVALISVLASLFFLRPWCGTLCPMRSVFEFINFGRNWFTRKHSKEK